MSDIIRLLPDSVANKIAAGEVVQRPASVVKELVENAIDAGSSEINVIITDAGKTSIQVIDNGGGMSETDARVAFERHATSKIREAEDLFSLHTMGFRGEALASISAVAEVEMKTCLKGEQIGTRLVVAGSKFISQEAEATPEGTSLTVKNLFFNVPARRKFLKANSTELNNIITEMERVALVNPDIAFTLHSNGSELLNLPVVPLRKRIMTLFGNKLDQQLLAVEVDTTLVKISGYVVKPEASRKKGARQFFFVNGRYMRHPYFHRAVMDAYDKLIPEGEQISYFLYFDVDPANIDVNIHPTKTEIKFENEQAIWQIITAAIRESLGKFNAVPMIDFDTEGMVEIPAFQQEEMVAPPTIDIDETYNPFESMSQGFPSERGKKSAEASLGGEYLYSGMNSGKSPKGWESLYEGLENAGSIEIPSAMSGDETPAGAAIISSRLNFEDDTDTRDSGAKYLQYKGKYLLVPSEKGIMIINQRRAHIRVLFDEYMENIRNNQRASQGVLFPEIIQFSVAETAFLESVMKEFTAVGFELTPMGGGSFAINGVPSGTEGIDAVDLVRNMVHSAMDKGDGMKNNVYEILSLSLAKSAALVYGQVLSREEIGRLVERLFASSSPNYTPDGKLVMTTLKNDEIEKMFSK